MGSRHRPQPIQLGAPQLAVILSGLVIVAVVVWAIGPYHWEDLYYRDVAIPAGRR